ncbi:MAG: acyltransferase family protein [Stenomitos frigidus ULC029]
MTGSFWGMAYSGETSLAFPGFIVSDRTKVFALTLKIAHVRALMAPTSIFPAIGLTILFFWIAKLIVKHSAFYQQVMQKADQAQYKALDGLRGFLALGVFFHHAVVNYQYFQIGTWQASPSNFYSFAGQGAVAFFFMITGFLFWSKIISGSRLNLKDFYIKRALRVLPAYWFSLAIIVFIVLIVSGFSLKVSLPRFFIQIGSWLICGIYGFSNVSNVFPDINYSSVGLINASVQWTLTYELQFYLILPFLVWFAKPSRFSGLFLTFLALSLVSSYQPLLTVMSFLFGMTAAYFIRRFKPNQQRFLSWQASLGIILLLVAIPTALPQPYLYNVGVIALIFFAFVLIAYGNDLFGLLTASASRYLGTISYSVYLLHGIIFFSVLRLVNQIYPIAGMHPIYFWMLVGLCGLIVISLSGLTYRYIEYPFLRVKSAVAAPSASSDRYPVEK